VQDVDRLVWADITPIAAGEFVLGVRTNSNRASQLIVSIFGDRAVEGATPPANFSVYLADPNTTLDESIRVRSRELHRFYDGCYPMVRSKSPYPVLEGLSAALGASDVRANRCDLMIGATAVASRREEIHLLPPSWLRGVLNAERRWRGTGFEVVGSRWLVLDARARRVAVPGKPLQLAPSAVRLLAEYVVEDDGRLLTDRRPLPIASWTVPASRSGPGARVAEATGQVVDRKAHDGRALVSTIASVLDGLPAIEAQWVDFSNLPSLLGSL
jgi:hypothetical protein